MLAMPKMAKRSPLRNMDKAVFYSAPESVQTFGDSTADASWLNTAIGASANYEMPATKTYSVNALRAEGVVR